jgi:hypothetical protein
MIENTKDSIEAALKPLVGLSLTAAKNFGDMRIFCFGALRPSRSGKGMVGSHALHIQCSWRLVDRDRVITGYTDYHLATNPDAEPDRDNVRSGNLQQVRMEEFLGEFDEELKFPVERTGRYIVTAIEPDRYGSVDIVLNGGDFRINVFTDSSGIEDWRFLSTEGDRSPHFVIAGGRITIKPSPHPAPCPSVP